MTRVISRLLLYLDDSNFELIHKFKQQLISIEKEQEQIKNKIQAMVNSPDNISLLKELQDQQSLLLAQYEIKVAKNFAIEAYRHQPNL